MDTATVKEKYLSFEGRLNRKTFIIRNLWISLASLVLGLPAVGMVYWIYTDPDAFVYYFKPYLYYSLLLGLIFLWPIMSLHIRRLHDLNKSAWWITLLFIPIVSCFFIIYLLFFKGTIGSNHFGEDPLAAKESTHFPLR